MTNDDNGTKNGNQGAVHGDDVREMPKTTASLEHSSRSAGRSKAASIDSADTNAPPTKSKPTIPLGWTQIKRKRNGGVGGRERKRVDRNGEASIGTNGGENDDDYCCDDPSCGPQWHNQSVPLSSTTATATSTAKSGRAIFCMLSANPSWIQGYFVPNHSGSNVTNDDPAKATDDIPPISPNKKPWGLLAVQQELDDCLQCADGGYRRVDLTVYPYSKNSNKKDSIIFPNVDWTGGDMVRLAGKQLSMETERLYTGSSVLPFLEQYFPQLVKRLLLRQAVDKENEGHTEQGDARHASDDRNTVETSDDRETSANLSKAAAARRLLQRTPDIAIVVGNLELDLNQS